MFREYSYAFILQHPLHQTRYLIVFFDQNTSGQFDNRDFRSKPGESLTDLYSYRSATEYYETFWQLSQLKNLFVCDKSCTGQSFDRRHGWSRTRRNAEPLCPHNAGCFILFKNNLDLVRIYEPRASKYHLDTHFLKNFRGVVVLDDLNNILHAASDRGERIL